MHWGDPKKGLSENDLNFYQRLTKPESQEFILDREDYNAFFTYSLFRGSVK